ncbi:hypothetical protein LTR48_007880 [Friedmanniomyces endolithicus]|nr:hypothetical protein LTR29_001143 [Friedmanniomyces endolithicus]KAK1090653.1 hypothetical protein LTR48_007880 [Friedmanniomyces endolithicus]
MTTFHSKSIHKSPHDTHKLPQDLKDWIDSDHTADSWRPQCYSVFLHKPTFTVADIQYALLYARHRFEIVLGAFTAAIKLAMFSYSGRIDIHAYVSTYGEDIVQLPDDCLEPWQWFGEESEVYIFHRPYLVKGEMVEHAQDPKFRRTIAALCRLRTRMERDNGELRRAILWEQDWGRGTDPMVRAERGEGSGSTTKWQVRLSLTASKKFVVSEDET